MLGIGIDVPTISKSLEKPIAIHKVGIRVAVRFHMSDESYICKGGCLQKE